MGNICNWNINSRDVSEIKEKTILIKNVEYHKTTFREMDTFLKSPLRNQTTFDHRKFYDFYRKCNIKNLDKDIIIFRYIVGNKSKIIVLYKDIFVNLLNIDSDKRKNRTNFSMDYFDFTPKDLKIETI